jgi:NDP-sugar pyrophosphorylase family protein/lipopolysaccharide/colanic/teichoic acid biosynthesis glycosyltransferase
LQAILLATGETRKLAPLTDTIPSPMLSVVNRPVMVYNVEMLGRLGFKQVVVSINKQAYLIESYFGNGRKWGMNFQYVLQRDCLGSAGALRWAKQLLNETFIVLPADEVIQLDLRHALQEHLDRKSVATVIVVNNYRENERGLEIDGNGRVLRLAFGSSCGSGWVDTNIYIFEPCVLELIPPRSPFDIHQQLLPALIESGNTVWASQVNGYWNPLTTFRSYAEAQRQFLSPDQDDEFNDEGNFKFRYTSIESREIARGIFIGRNAKVHPSANLVSPISIGNNSWIGREVELGPYTIIGANVIIDDEATVSQSIVLDHTYVGKLVNIEKRLVNQNLLVDLLSEEQVQVTEPFLLGPIKPDLVYERFRRVLDFTLSASILLIMLPFTLIIASLVWLSTGKVFQSVPYFTVDMKSTEDNENTANIDFLHHFNISRNGEEPGWLGKWLVSWEGHRLPELLNVLKGKLRMIGLAPVFLGESIPLMSIDLSSYTDSSTGFSGLWYIQTNYDGGLHANQLEEALIIDKYYLATRNWRQYLWLLWKTPSAWYRRVQHKVDSYLTVIEVRRSWK